MNHQDNLNAIQIEIEPRKRHRTLIPKKTLIRTEEEIQGIREAGIINTKLLDELIERVKVGVTTADLDCWLLQRTREMGGEPATLGYNGYPNSCCISINDEVCHGIPSDDCLLSAGDIINLDLSTIYKGFFADSARVVVLGPINDRENQLVQVAKKAIDVGLQAVKPWDSMKNVGKAIWKYVKSEGFTVATAIGGHGIGLQFHEEPFVSFDAVGTDVLMVPGMVFTIEPAITMVSHDVFEGLDNDWTIYTADGKPSAQWEVTVLVTETGYEVLAY